MFQKPKRPFAHSSTSHAKPTTSWGQVAAWYDDLLAKEGTFQKDVILPGILAMMQVRPGQKILDIACGTGFFTRAFARAGANVVGCDISKELVDLARRDSPALTFKVTPAEKLGIFAEASFDAATIIMAIQNIQKYQRAIVEAARVLRPGGKLYIVMTHPAFRVPRASGWKFINNAQVRLVEKYASEFSVEMHMHGQSGQKTISFHRPLASYIKAMKAVGLALTDLEEWGSNKQSTSGPHAAAENKARKEIPLFLALEATKL